MSEAGRDYLYAHAEDVMKLTSWYVGRFVMPLISRMPAWVQADPTLADEDLIQDGLTKIYTVADYYDPDRSSLSTWLCEILHNYYTLRVCTIPFRLSHIPPDRLPLVSLDQEITDLNNETNGTRLGDMIPDPGVNVEEEYLQQEEYETASRLINELLTPRERYVLRETLKGRTMEEIGADIDRSRERVRQLKNAALRRTSHVWHKAQKKDEAFLTGEAPKKKTKGRAVR